MTKCNLVYVGVRMHPDTVAKVKEIVAKDKNKTLSDYIRNVVNESVNHD